MDALQDEMCNIFNQKVMKQINTMDDKIDSAKILHEEGFEGSIHVSEIVNIQNGIMTIETPKESLFYDRDLSEFDFDGTPGQVLTRKWTDDHWVTVSE